MLAAPSLSIAIFEAPCSRLLHVEEQYFLSPRDGRKQNIDFMLRPLAIDGYWFRYGFFCKY